MKDPDLITQVGANPNQNTLEGATHMILTTTVGDLTSVTVTACEDHFSPITVTIGSLRIHLPLLQAIELRKALSSAITDSDEITLRHALFDGPDDEYTEVMNKLLENNARVLGELFGGDVA